MAKKHARRDVIIVLTGPESCGKTQLAEQLSVRLSLPVVAEHARNYLQSMPPGWQYKPSDLIALVKLQQASEEGAHNLILDTDLLTLIIWWREKYGPVPAVFQDAMQCQSPRHYLLCAPDIVWQPDPLRENPLDRERLFEIYQHELRVRDLPFDVVHGIGQKRLDCAIAALEKRTSNRTIG